MDYRILLLSVLPLPRLGGRLLLSLLFMLFPATAALAQPDVKTFTDFPVFEDMKISPGGKYLAYTQRFEGREYLLVLRTDDLSAVSSTSFGDQGQIQTFDWVSEERILMSPARAFSQIDFLQPTGEIFGIDADGRNFEMLFGYRAGQINDTNTRFTRRQSMMSYGELVDSLPDDKNYVIIQNKGYGIDGEANSAWRMHVRSGRLKELRWSPLYNGNFITDHNHEVRFAYGVNKENRFELHYLDEHNDWELVTSSETEEYLMAPIAPYGQDGRMLVRVNEGGLASLAVWDPATGEQEIIFRHEMVDINGAYFDNSYTLWAVRFFDHFPDYFYPDPEHPLVKLHLHLRATFPDQDVQIIDETDDLSKVIVHFSSPRNPGDFVLMDVETMQYLYRIPKYPNFPIESLSRMDPIELIARDGTQLRGNLTLPTGSTEVDLPMVVLVHGGPYGIADNWGYRNEVQLLASRGYAVLQVNFRGSGGRGKDFLESGFGEWGGAMQDDITDAVLWAVNDGIADPDRICIFGASYGGYAALTGAFREPDLFKCAIGMSGVYDLNLMLETGDIAEADRGRFYLDEALGDDPSLLSSRSPVNNAEKIKAEVLLLHGQLDERSPFVHYERMRDALVSAGKEPVLMVAPNEAHGIYSEENRVTVYETILDFLEQNIGN